MDRHCDNQYDSTFSTLKETTKLAWYPWVGRDYASSPSRILVIGESHYVTTRDDKPDILENIKEWENDPLVTRICVWESNIEDDWYNKTWGNLMRFLVGENEKVDKTALWEHISYYNFVQRPMNYGGTNREQPTGEDFSQGWKSFIPVVETLNPDFCIFIGVRAANSFNGMMDCLGIEHLNIEGLPKVNKTYPRRSSVTINGKKIPLLFIRHCGKYFSWDLWHKLLLQEMPDAVKIMKECRKTDK